MKGGGQEPSSPIKTDSQFEADLSSYEAACRDDPALQHFDETLHQSTTHVISTIASDLGVPSLSLNSLVVVTSCLFGTNEQVADIIFGENIWDKDLLSLVEEYFENSKKTLEFCTALENCFRRARNNQKVLLCAIRRLEEEAELQVETDKKRYVEALEELRKFRAAEEPFTKDFFAQLEAVRRQQESMLGKLLDRKRKLDKKLKSLKTWSRMSNALFVATFVCVLIFSVVAAAIAAPPVVTALAGALAVPIGSTGKWCNLLWKCYANELRGQELITKMEIGSCFTIHDTENIRLLVTRLEIMIESLLHYADFAPTVEGAVKLAIDEIKRNLEEFMGTIELWAAHADVCSNYIRTARMRNRQRLRGQSAFGMSTTGESPSPTTGVIIGMSTTGESHWDLKPHGKIEGEIIPSESEASLEIVEEEANQNGDSSSNSWSPCIFRTPFPELEFQKPALVSIGPYHRDVDHPLDKYKHSFLEKLVSRKSKYPERDLSFYVGEIIALENQARACYSDKLGMSSRDFVKMMLLDGCFIIELLRQFGGSSEGDLFYEDPVNIIVPWQIPILIQDFLLLENQIPFFILLKLFDLSKNVEGNPEVYVTTMAMKFFDLAFPRSSDFISGNQLFKPNHLLDLFVNTLLASNPRNIFDLDPPSNRGSKRAENETEYQSPVPLEKGVAELQLAGIKFMPNRTNNSFFDFNFKGGVLEIPLVTINNLFSTILVNSMALETCSPYHRFNIKPFTRYIYFMSTLIKEANDVKFLCSKGIISTFSSNDKKVADLFNLLGRYAVPDFSDSELWNTIRAMQCYDGKMRNPVLQFMMDPSVVFFMFFAFIVSTICLRFWEFMSGRLVQSLVLHGLAGWIGVLCLQDGRRQHVLKNPEVMLRIFRVLATCLLLYYAFVTEL